MSFANQNSRWTYAPNGVTTTFVYDNKILAAADLVVTWYGSDGSTLVLPGYSVTGAGNDNGGTVVFNAAPAATAGSLIVIERRTPAVQAGDFLDFLQEPAQTRQARFERAMALAQEFTKAQQRMLLLSPLDADGAFTLPPAASRINKALLFGPDGKPMVGSPLAAGVLAVSAYVQTLLDDADANAFHATLGWSVFAKGLRGSADAPTFRAAIGAVGGDQGPTVSQGRLTLATGLSVMGAALLNRTVIYYTPHVGQLVMLWNGVNFAPAVFPELTNDTTAAAVGKAGPAVVGNNLNYDLFVWDDAGTRRLTRGPAWATDIARGVGAGTTELQIVQGIRTNKYDIVNGPLAGYGTYVGTVRSSGTAQIDWNPMPAAAAGGGNAMLGVFNAYQRVRVLAQSQDSTPNWAYALNPWRALNGSNANRISYIDGQGEVMPAVGLQLVSRNTTMHYIGVNRDSVVATPPLTSGAWNITSAIGLSGGFAGALGFHYLQAMEADTGGAFTLQYGADNPTGVVIPAQLNNFTADLVL